MEQAGPWGSRTHSVLGSTVRSAARLVFLEDRAPRCHATTYPERSGPQRDRPSTSFPQPDTEPRWAGPSRGLQGRKLSQHLEAPASLSSGLFLSLHKHSAACSRLSHSHPPASSCGGPVRTLGLPDHPGSPPISLSPTHRVPSARVPHVPLSCPASTYLGELGPACLWGTVIQPARLPIPVLFALLTPILAPK